MLPGRMSQANVEIVRSIYAEPEGLTSAASDSFAPDAEFDFTNIYPEEPLVKGVEDLRRFRKTNPWSGAPIDFTLERVFDVDDDRVLVFVLASATGHGSGAPVERRVAHEFTIRDDLVVRFKVYADRDQALETAGLAADPPM